MTRIILVLLAMVVLMAVPCLAFNGFQGHQGQIPLCQNNTTGVSRLAPTKNIGSTKSVDYEPFCNTKTETLIWINPAGGGPAGPAGPPGPPGPQGPPGIANGATQIVYGAVGSDGTTLTCNGYPDCQFNTQRIDVVIPGDPTYYQYLIDFPYPLFANGQPWTCSVTPGADYISLISTILSSVIWYGKVPPSLVQYTTSNHDSILVVEFGSNFLYPPTASIFTFICVQ